MTRLHPMTRLHKNLLLCTLLSFGAISLLASEAEASETQLLGTWQLLHVEKKGKKGQLPPGFKVTMRYKKDHTWEGTMERHGKVKHNTGTWKLTGKTLVVQPKGKQGDSMTVTFVGNMLKLTKTGDQGTAVFKRVK